jgi:hypothetical protein
VIAVASGAAGPTALSGLPLTLELVLEGTDDEVHQGHVGLDAVKLQLAVELLRDAGRQLYPDFVFSRHMVPFTLARPIAGPVG